MFATSQFIRRSTFRGAADSFAFGRFAVSSLLLGWLLIGMQMPEQLWADSPNLNRPIRSQKDVVYGEVDGRKLYADLYRPDDQQSYPGILMIHGGAWSSGNKWNMSDHARELAQ